MNKCVTGVHAACYPAYKNGNYSRRSSINGEEGGMEGGPHARVLYVILALEDQIFVILPGKL